MRERPADSQEPQSQINRLTSRASRLLRTPRAMAFAVLATTLALTQSADAQIPGQNQVTMTPTRALNGDPSSAASGGSDRLSEGSVRSSSPESASATPTSVAPGRGKNTALETSTPGSILVRTRASVLMPGASSLDVLASGEGTPVGMGRLGINAIRVDNVAEALRRYRLRGFDAEPNGRLYTAEVAGGRIARLDSLVWQIGPAFVGPWNIQKTETHAAWLATSPPRRGQGIKVAVVDTGIYNHPYLSGRITNSVDFTGSVNGTNDVHGHGTHVAGTVGAGRVDAAGIGGMALEVSLMNAKGLGDTGSGSFESVANSMVWAVDNGAKVINMSLGAPDLDCPQTLLAATQYAHNNDVVVFAAAGNSGRESIHTPANCGAIPVGATTITDERAAYSNYGPDVAIWAPGGGTGLPGDPRILSLSRSESGTTEQSGTSMATPHAAGLAALIREANAVLTHIQVRDQMIANADDIAAGKRINARRALGLSLPPTPTSTLTPTNTRTATPTTTPGPCEAPMQIDTITTGAYIQSEITSRSGNFRNPPFTELNPLRESSGGIVQVVSGGAGSDEMVIRIHRATQDGPITVPMLIHDACPTSWQTFIGYGMGPNRPWTLTPTP